jgi:hypothetical protein
VPGGAIALEFVLDAVVLVAEGASGKVVAGCCDASFFVTAVPL